MFWNISFFFFWMLFIKQLAQNCPRDTWNIIYRPLRLIKRTFTEDWDARQKQFWRTEIEPWIRQSTCKEEIALVRNPVDEYWACINDNPYGQILLCGGVHLMCRRWRGWGSWKHWQALLLLMRALFELQHYRCRRGNITYMHCRHYLFNYMENMRKYNVYAL